MSNNQFQIFVLKALRKLSWALLTGKYEVRDIEKIHQDTGIHLEELGEDKDD